LKQVVCTLDRVDGESVAQLVRRASDGDEGSYHTLVDEFGRLVWAICRSHRLDTATAADVSQTVWLRVVEHLGRIREPERFGAWISTTTRHECLAVLRQQQRTSPSIIDLTEVADRSDHVGNSMEQRERVAAVKVALDELADPCRSLLRLLFTEPPLAYGDIAAALDMPVGSIGPTRSRCLAKLAEHPAIRAQSSV
jgi:RNA polymerase sigma factor (sigma-70 family)